jgi:hypothetical protein
MPDKDISLLGIRLRVADVENVINQCDEDILALVAIGEKFISGDDDAGFDGLVAQHAALVSKKLFLERLREKIRNENTLDNPDKNAARVEQADALGFALAAVLK